MREKYKNGTETVYFFEKVFYENDENVLCYGKKNIKTGFWERTMIIKDIFCSDIGLLVELRKFCCKQNRIASSDGIEIDFVCSSRNATKMKKEKKKKLLVFTKS